MEECECEECKEIIDDISGAVEWANNEIAAGIDDPYSTTRLEDHLNQLHQEIKLLKHSDRALHDIISIVLPAIRDPKTKEVLEKIYAKSQST